MASTEIQSHSKPSIPELSGIESFADALALAGKLAGGIEQVVKSTDMGDGFALISTAEKARLVNVQSVILDYSFGTSEDFQDQEGNPGRFVVLRLVTVTGSKLILTDGSTGICDQITAHVNDTGGFGENGQPLRIVPILLMKGLRSSTYKVVDENGTTKSATTYYLDTSL